MTGDFRNWQQVFERRKGPGPPLSEIGRGPRDESPPVVTALRLGAHWEQLGCEVLMRASRQAEDPLSARCIEQQAREEAAHARTLRELLGPVRPLAPPAPVRWSEWFVTRPMGLVEQMLATLIIEAWGVGIYETLIEAVGPGRVSRALTSIIDDERLHFDFTRDFLVDVLPTLPPRRLRALRRLRTWLIGALLLGTALGFRRYMRPISPISRAALRRRVLAEIESSLRGVPGLAVPGP